MEFGAPPVEYTFYLLFQAARQRDIRFDRILSGTGLSMARWRTLAIIGRISNCTMTDLALYTGVDRTTLTRSVDQMVARGLVERMVQNRDRRKVCLTLSEHGRAAYSRGAALLWRDTETLLEGVPAEAVETTTAVLQLLLRRLIDSPVAAEQVIGFSRPES